MHTLKIRDVIFIYHPDLSEVRICVPHSADMGKASDVVIDGRILLDFVAEYIRNQRISALEQMDTNDLLNITK